MKQIDITYELIKLTYPECIEEISRLRILAWKNEEGINPDFFSKAQWVEEIDKTAMHWAVFKDKVLIASARLSIHDDLKTVPYGEILAKVPDANFKFPLATLNRLVVHPEFRNHGLSGALDAVRIAEAKKQNAKCLIGQPHGRRGDMLINYGFEPVAEVQLPEFPLAKFTLMILDLEE
jgi:predicted GNAT family N-acyltransferase